MAFILQDLPSITSSYTSKISFLLALFTCMTSQSSLSRSPRSPARTPPSPPPPPPLASSCPQQCNNHGDCVRGDSDDVIYCQCHQSWSGNACAQPCDKMCVYGKCQIVGHVQMCICPLGYYGDRCEHKDPDVSSFLHMAKTLSQVMWNKIFPLIQDPGQKLEKLIQNGSSDCSSTFRCHNGGKCKHGQVGGYRCQCTSSKYTGDFCQFMCPRACVNGGRCIRYRKRSAPSTSSTTTSTSTVLSDGSDDLQYACACPKDFYGRFCQRKRSRDSTSYLK